MNMCQNKNSINQRLDNKQNKKINKKKTRYIVNKIYKTILT